MCTCMITMSFFFPFRFNNFHYLMECIDYNSRLASACYIIIYEFPFIFLVFASNFVTRGAGGVDRSPRLEQRVRDWAV